MARLAAGDAGGAGRPLKAKELARELGVSGDDYRGLRQLLRELEATGQLTRVQKGRFTLSVALTRHWGRLHLHPRGFAFLERAGAEADVFISADSLHDAADGDWVEVEITDPGDGRRRLPRGRVVGVRQQPTPRRLGTFRRRGRRGVVVTDAALIHLDSPPPQEVRDGDLVIIERPDGPAGRGDRGWHVARVLGDPDDPRHDFEAVCVTHGIPTQDSVAVSDGAGALVAAGGLTELAGRRDLRQLTVVTIDPEAARDFDDAVSLEALPGGLQRLGVHIADVAHFVPAGGAIDLQARERGASVYLLDRVVHMLPQSLAAQRCSLLPGQDRLTVSVFLDIDSGGQVRERQICLSVIRSAARLTYAQVRATLDEDGDAAGTWGALLRDMASLARRLRACRFDRGAIDFDLPEAEVHLGDDGVPTRLGRAARWESHRLVEEFMLAANEAVAEEAAAAGLPVLYRIHDPPDPDKLKLFRDLAASLGHPLPGVRGLTSAHLQAALEALRDSADTALLGQLLLRAMMRARYATDEAEGHFGLASPRYLHFTSPIRRYPDLMVQRALRAHLRGDAPAADDLDWLAQWTSHCERRAEAAERDYVRLKQLRFMAQRVGEEYEGPISGVVGAGFFVQLGDWLVEGFCPVRLLGDDFEFDEVRHRLRGQHTGVVFTLGMPARVRVLSVDPLLRRMDLLFLEGKDSGAPRRRRGGKGRTRGRGVRRAAASARRQTQRSRRQAKAGSPRRQGRRGRSRPR